tara:strand:+ start:1396 stop:2160 length:765 start_codon:yes stop_codon:yes gene_type:complete
MIDLYKGDCLEVMKEIESGSVDAIICDPPYGTTACKWDSVIDFDLMWEQLNRIIKPNGAIVLFGSEPFSSALRMSNIKDYKYDWIWIKTRPSGLMHSKNMPMKKHENISVFSCAKIGHKSQLKDKRMDYYPQGLVKIDKVHKRPKPNGSGSLTLGNRPSLKKEFKVEFTNYPNSILDFASVHNVGALHPTQKPIALMEYLIKTYTNENETVLDFTMGSGTTGVAAKQTNRNFIGIEQDENYFNIASERINGTLF